MVSRYSHHEVNIDYLKYYCFWCNGIDQHKSPTYIEFDLMMHLFESHKMAMVKVPIGKGDMTIRLDYAIDQCKKMTLHLREQPEKWDELFGGSNSIKQYCTVAKSKIESEESPEVEEEVVI